MDLVIQQIPETEYNELFHQLEEYVKLDSKYIHSAAGLVNSLITNLPKQAQMAKEIIDGFDPTQYQNVIAFVYDLMKTLDDVFLGFASASGIKRIGRYVQYAHHLRLGKVHQPTIDIDV